MTRILGLVQARMSSRRLPGKVLAEIAGRPLVWHAVTRLEAARVCDAVVVATSSDPSDDPLVERCAEMGFAVFRGSLEDVLDRFHRAALRWRADAVVRATADCPLLDPALIVEVVERYRRGSYDYVSNGVERSFPKGLDIEVVSGSAMARAWREARLPSEREHVTPYVWKHPERFRIGSVRQAVDQSRLRWTVDEPRDLEFVRAVFDGLGRLRFSRQEVLALLERRPELARINEGIDPDEGYRRSLDRDAEAE